MGPQEILDFLRDYKVPHELIAKAIGRDRTAATKMLRGVRSIKATEVEPLSRLVSEYRESEAFKRATAADIQRSQRIIDRGADEYFREMLLAGLVPGQLPIRDPVQAGAWLEVNVLDQREPTMYPASLDPRFPDARQWLSPVRGDSMNALTKNGLPAGILDGDLVHIVDAIDINYRPAAGDVVEVERSRFDGAVRELTLKQIEITASGEILLCPRSTNPLFRDPIPYKEDAAASEVRIRGRMVQVIRPFI